LTSKLKVKYFDVISLLLIFIDITQNALLQYGPVSDGISLPLNIYAKLKNWCERAKDRHYHNHGPAKSTLKRRPYITMSGPLVGE